MRKRRMWSPMLLFAIAAGLVVTVAGLSGRHADAPVSAALAQAPGLACPPSPSSAPGKDFHGQTLAGASANFSRQDLTNANFEGATLNGAVFIGANLTGANFRNVKVVKSPNSAVQPTDFSFADLNGACFIGAQFQDLTYFTYATLTCADFSQTDLSTGNAVFGDAALRFDTSACRPAFRSTAMSCEFLDQWDLLNLSGATVSACSSRFKGHDFAGAVMPDVVFDGVDLTGSNWRGANLAGASFKGATLDHATGLSGTTADPSQLAGARFNNASVRFVDLSNAQLYGANFTNANLEGASLAGSFLTNNPGAGIRDPANFTGAHLKNVNLSGAQLTGTIFDQASFYGSFGGVAPAFPCKTDISQCGKLPVTGFTCSCATAAGATMTNTKFTSAFLYGVDFSGATTTVNGVSFNGAVLVAANFANATFSVDPSKGGAPPDFSYAHLQGANLAGANLTSASLTGAFVDFGASTNPNAGNVMQFVLSPAYTAFKGWKAPSQPVCVLAAYGAFTTVPTTIPSMTCPDGNQYPGPGAVGCGAAQAGNAHWASGTPIGQATPPGFYTFDATYGKANQSGPCNLGTADTTW